MSASCTKRRAKRLAKIFREAAMFIEGGDCFFACTAIRIIAKLGYDVWHRIDTAGGPIGSGHSAAQAWKMAWMRISL